MRLHQTPERTKVEHCRWWLRLELAFIRPRLTLALADKAAWLVARPGALESRLHDGPVLVSWHPAHLLRRTDPDSQDRARHELIDDLRTAHEMTHPSA